MSEQNNATACIDSARFGVADLARLVERFKERPPHPEPLYLIVPHTNADRYRAAFAGAYCVVIDEKDLEPFGLADAVSVCFNSIRAHRVSDYHEIPVATAPAKPSKPYYRRFERKRRPR